jgi:hypothetical protein
MLDPATVQILFADLQPPIVARSKTNPPQSLSRAASVLAECARRRARGRRGAGGVAGPRKGNRGCTSSLA